MNYIVRSKIFTFILFALGLYLSTCLFPHIAKAQGILIPKESVSVPIAKHPVRIPSTLKVKSIKITTSIKNQVSRTKVEQVFLNETPYTLEGTYCFPIPDNASLSEFAIYEGNKRLVGEVIERNKARQIYNDIVRTMRDPGLLEYVGKDLFQASVFPIPGKSEKKIELVYSQVLQAENGIVNYRYPLGSGQRTTNLPPQSVVGTVEIDSQVAIKTVYSPSHLIDLKREGERGARISFEVSGQKSTEDFQLYYGLSDKDFGVSLLTHREPGKDGYFLLIIAPKVTLSDRDRLAKDIVFVFDTSGSMSGEKIEKAQNALRFGLRSLSEQDRFNVVRFSGEEHLFESGLVTATAETIRRATRFVDDFRAEGGTNIHDALLSALKLFDSSNDRAKMVIFVTDGLPTVGTTNSEAIQQGVKKANAAGVRLFTFGVGYDVNTQLLDKLANENRGVSDYVEPNEDLEVKVSNFFGRVHYPVLSDLKLDFGNVSTENIYPKTLPDLFRGGQITLVGRYKSEADRAAVLKLIGRMQGKEQTFVYEGQRFARTESDNSFLPKLWATRRVGALMEQIRSGGENKELVDEIVQLGTKHGIVTPYTSYLAKEDKFEERRERLGGGLANSPIKPGRHMDEKIMASTISGEGAVKKSKEVAQLRDAEVIANQSESDSARTIGSKKFTLIDGVWTDSEFKKDEKLPVVELKFGSEQYFTLLQQKPKLAEYFSLGTKVVVVFDGKLYKVMD